jgi:hypothetical protein
MGATTINSPGLFDPPLLLQPDEGAASSSTPASTKTATEHTVAVLVLVIDGPKPILLAQTVRRSR